MPKARASQPYVDDELKKAFSLPDLPPPSESKLKPNSTAKTFSPPSQSAFGAVVNFFSNSLAALQGKQGDMAGFQYPGVNLPLNTSDRWRFDELPPVYAIGMPQARGAISTILPVREVAMMLVMEKLTDKPNWHEKVFDEAIVQKWREEARTQSENGLYSRIMEGKFHFNEIPMPQSRIISEEAFEFVRGLPPFAMRWPADEDFWKNYSALLSCATRRLTLSRLV